MDYFNKLPVEIIKMIFEMSVSDDLEILNHRRVCKKWLSVIDTIKFEKELRIRVISKLIEYFNWKSEEDEIKNQNMLNDQNLTNTNKGSVKKLKDRTFRFELVSKLPKIKKVQIGFLCQVYLELIDFYEFCLEIDKESEKCKLNLYWDQNEILLKTEDNNLEKFDCDNLQTTEPDQCPVIIASTPREPVSCSKQWKNAAISLLTTCRSMDKKSSNERCSMNQFNELGEKSETSLEFKSFDLNSQNLDKTLQTSYCPKPQKRLSIYESGNTGLFRLNCLAKDAFDKVTKKVMMNNHSKDYLSDLSKCNLKIDSKSNFKNNLKNNFKSDLNFRTKSKSEFKRDQKLYLNSDQQLNYLKSDLKLDRQVKANEYLSNDVIIEDNLVNKLSRSETSLNLDQDLNFDDQLNGIIMPEPLFTELELDELCNRSLNCSSDSTNSSNSSIDCKQSVEQFKDQLNFVKKFGSKEIRHADLMNDKKSDYSDKFNGQFDKSNESNESNKSNKSNKLTITDKNDKLNKIDDLNEDIDKNLDKIVDKIMDKNRLKDEVKELKKLKDDNFNNINDQLNSPNDEKKEVLLKDEQITEKDENNQKSISANSELIFVKNDQIKQQTNKDVTNNNVNFELSTKDRIDQLIDSCFKVQHKTLTDSLASTPNIDQFNFEQQTDNLVEEMYFTAELGDQQKSIQTINELSTNTIVNLNQQNQVQPENNSKMSSISITKIQVYSQQTTKSINETDQFELQSNSSIECSSDGVEIKVDEEEDNKCDSDVCKSSVKSVDSGTSSCSDIIQDYLIVVAIDFGTTYSGYAFSFVKEPDQIHMMRNPIQSNNLTSHKAPTALLLTPNGNFHSFGQLARETYHNLSNEQAAKWLFFDKFKMELHRFDGQELTKHTTIQAANGVQIKALIVFSMALRYFRKLAIEQLEQQCGSKVTDCRYIKYVITVPAIWSETAKQFMRKAAYLAGLASEQRPNQLLIALEPEAASIYCRKLKLNQLIKPEITSNSSSPVLNENKSSIQDTLLEKCFEKGTRYLVVDLGGGTVDITVHEIQDDSDKRIQLKELFYGGGSFGSITVDKQFELFLIRLFGQEFIEKYKLQFPSGYVDLMSSFEARKRTATIIENEEQLNQTLNITLPFSFINAFKKHKNGSIEQYLKRFYSTNRDFVDKDEITYCTKSGMIRLKPSFMYKLFEPICAQIVQHISQIIMNDEVNNSERPLKFCFLVGGFAESQLVQYVVRSTFTSSSCLSNDKLGIVDRLSDMLIDKLSLIDKNVIVEQTNEANKSIEKYQLTGQTVNGNVEQLNVDKNTVDKTIKSSNSNINAINDSTITGQSNIKKIKRSLNKLIKLDSKSIKVTSSGKRQDEENKKSISLTNKQNIKNLEFLRKKCESLRIIIPQEVSSAILKGACMYGLDPNMITVRRSRLTYGIGILNRFQPGHPKSKLIIRDGVEWCTDVFDKFVKSYQEITLGECVQRSYTPAKPNQKTLILNIYCCEREDVEFVTDPGVTRCGQMILDLEPMINSRSNSERSSPEMSSSSDNSSLNLTKPNDVNETREIITKMIFADTEIRIFAVDSSTNKSVKAEIDFLST